eukprot:CAMPEP_0117046044 /NCGR_PEP_ID=MMETSP0472-20121206/31847_1 /TAXON_ID=693140 ORGANISM="Tiarina fusus, Strain LIS" /NCGR_SAMPLE_ID=MMETSP0472 /ASSEMBLY_ACC=CAM_ASM_000603 /LENGTH=336 /DNA_ID=CAMNT_0004758265 /DNA_START=13 /DNA_END=1023 /DNA_ORIENTATION=-
MLPSSFSKPTHFSLLLLMVSLQGKTSLAGQSGFLKEILLGRCYENPPDGRGKDGSGCPATVGLIMGILEGHKDADLDASTFDGYVKNADFNSPKDGALFWLHGGGAPTSFLVAKPPGAVTPEETPGGALLSNVVFCGVDQRQGCKIEESNAYWSFWKAAYKEFAARVSGKVTVIVEPTADVDFFTASAVSNFQKGKVTDVMVVVKNCGFVSNLLAELKNVVPSDDLVTCTTPAEMNALICTADDDTNEEASQVGTVQEEEDYDEENETASLDEGGESHAFRNLLLVSLVSAITWWCYDGGRWHEYKVTSSSYGTVPVTEEEMAEEAPATAEAGRYQ